MNCATLKDSEVVQRRQSHESHGVNSVHAVLDITKIVFSILKLDKIQTNQSQNNSLTRLLHQKCRVEECQFVAWVQLECVIEVLQSFRWVFHLDVDDGQVVPQVSVGAIQLQGSEVGVPRFAQLVHLQKKLPSEMKEKTINEQHTKRNQNSVGILYFT